MYLLLNHKQLLYKILPYGCQMNFSDGERFAGQLERMGYKPAEKLENADIIIINTCCVRESAEKKINLFLVVIYHFVPGTDIPPPSDLCSWMAVS